MSEDGKDPFKMKFCIGTNFDFKLIDEIDQYNKDGCITSVFGKVRSDWLGGGRPSLYLPEVSIRTVGEYIKACHRKNLKFNYLLNPMCYANREFQKRYHRKLMRYLEQLTELGVDAVTINSQYICEVIKSKFPHFKVTVGAYALIDSLHKLRYWEGLGADEIQLNRQERNFPLLELLLKHTSKTGTGLRLIANNVCLHDCACGVAHGTSLAHASRKGEYSKDFHLDYFLLKCTYERMRHPVKIISSEWIRPEDIHYYEELCRRTGNRNFSIKLLDRAKTTEFLARVLKAYTSRSYEGNLVDLLHWPSRKEIKEIHLLPAYIKGITGFYSPELRKIPSLFDLPSVYIDNGKLDGFLEAFVSDYDCDHKLCDETGWKERYEEDQTGSEARCSYCRTWAEKAISRDEDQVAKWIEKQKGILAGLVSGRLFHAFGSR